MQVMDFAPQYCSYSCDLVEGCLLDWYDLKNTLFFSAETVSFGFLQNWLELRTLISICCKDRDGKQNRGTFPTVYQLA